MAKREDALGASPVEAVAMSMQQRAERHLERMAGISERGVDHMETMDGPAILDSVDQIENSPRSPHGRFGWMIIHYLLASR